MWGDHREDRKGQALVDWMASLRLLACNRGGKPTFSRAHIGGVSNSHIDITFISEEVQNAVQDWQVLDGYTGSLHRYIEFDLGQRERGIRQAPSRRWAWRKLDRDKLRDFAGRTDPPPSRGGTAANSAAIGEFLREACASCMPSVTYRAGKKPVFWWTEEIANYREDCHKARRRYTRSRRASSPATAEAERELFRECRGRLKKAIRRSKEACWASLCDQVENDPWGLPYRLVTKKLLGRRAIPELTAPGRMETIVDALFPNVPETPPPEQLPVQVEFPEVSLAEVTASAGRLPTGKAPGPDGVPDTVVREVTLRRPEIIQELFNACLQEGEFPEQWKIAKLVLLRKGEKPLDQPSSYRPICLLEPLRARDKVQTGVPLGSKRRATQRSAVRLPQGTVNRRRSLEGDGDSGRSVVGSAPPEGTLCSHSARRA